MCGTPVAVVPKSPSILLILNLPLSVPFEEKEKTNISTCTINNTYSPSRRSRKYPVMHTVDRHKAISVVEALLLFAFK